MNTGIRAKTAKFLQENPGLTPVAGTFFEFSSEKGLAGCCILGAAYLALAEPDIRSKYRYGGCPPLLIGTIEDREIIQKFDLNPNKPWSEHLLLLPE